MTDFILQDMAPNLPLCKKVVMMHPDSIDDFIGIMGVSKSNAHLLVGTKLIKSPLVEKGVLRLVPADTIIPTQADSSEYQYKVIPPTQCHCGRLFLEVYQFKEPNSKGEIGFCWCGYCRTKVMFKPCDTLK